MRLLLAASLFMAFTSQAFAATETSQVNRSAKKVKAGQTKLREPQVLEVGDNTIGLRLGQGAVFDGSTVIGGSFEHMITPYVGLGGDLRYSSYSSRWASGPYSGQWDYTVMTVVGHANFHADLFKVQNLDTYATVGLGRSIINSKWKTNVSGLNAPNAADSSSNFLVAYLNGRYFFNAEFALVGSIGLGLGTLGIGADYLF